MKSIQHSIPSERDFKRKGNSRYLLLTCLLLIAHIVFTLIFWYADKVINSDFSTIILVPQRKSVLNTNSPNQITGNLVSNPQNHGKRIKFDNPLHYSQIYNPTIPKETYIPHLDIQWTLYGPDHLGVVIRDADQERYELPYEDPYPHPRYPPLSDLADSNFKLEIGTEPLSIVIRRKSTNEIIFELIDRFVYSDLYIEFSFKVPTKNIYGFGERITYLQFPETGTYTVAILDRAGFIDPGLPALNSNGHQSVYLMAEASKKYHMMALRNFNSQEVVLNGNKELTWKTIGGVLDFNFFLGDNPEEAVDKYHKYIGGWALPALWHLGLHQSKWRGYKTVDDMEYVLKEFERVKLPLDGLWSDLDYFKHEVNFWFDEDNYPPEKMRELYRKYKKRWVPIVQELIPFQKESHAWTFPNVTSVVIRDGLDPSQPLIGQEFSGNAYFIDDFHPDSEAYWYEMYGYLNSKIPLDGIWHDANEMTNFVHFKGSKDPAILAHIKLDPGRKYYNYSFHPGGENPYATAAVDFDAVHYGGIKEYNVRPVNSLLQSKHAYTYMQTLGRQFPFVISRADTMGTGQYAYHFIPDVWSNWNHLRVSTVQVSMFNIFGMTMVGPDICGMSGEPQTPPELCARWYQSAAFYPFARNQHQPQNIFNFQEPYRYFGVYFDAIAASIYLRYSLLKQMYAIFFNKINRDLMLGTGTIFRPMFFEFATDANLPPYGHVTHEDQFMLGDLVLVTPVVYKGNTTVEAYFPDCRWFDLRDNKELPARGQLMNVSAELTELPPHYLRGGYIFFKQGTEGVMRSEDLNNTFNVIVGLKDLNHTVSQISSKATGYILSATDYEEKYIYDNCVLKSCMLKTTVLYNVNLNHRTTNITIKVQNVETGSISDAIEVNEISILGVSSESLEEGQKIECSNCADGESLELSVGDGWIKISSAKLKFKDGAVYNFKLSRH